MVLCLSCQRASALSAATPTLKRREETKINNCIANRKVFIGNNKDEYERQKEIFILVKIKLMVNKSKRR